MRMHDRGHAIFMRQDRLSDYRSIAIIEHYKRNGVHTAPKVFFLDALSLRPRCGTRRAATSIRLT